MNQKLLFLILTCSFFFSCSTKEDKIKTVVNRWNDAHNTRNIEEFKEIYAPDVLFYGRLTSMESCYEKKKAFLTSEFRQDIISAIIISYYSSGTVKCDFTKRTRYRTDKVREYYCYLLLEKRGGRYLITGESDLLSDQKRNTQLNLGTKLARPSGNRAIYIIVAVLLLAAGGFYWVKKRNKREANEWEIFKEQYKAPVQPQSDLVKTNEPVLAKLDEEDLAIKIKTAVLEEMKNHIPGNSSKQKGDLFEKFVVERFDSNYFRLTEWRGDKIHNEISPASSRLPDLEYHFTTAKENCFIGIECKWRAAFYNNRIEIARQDQLINYWQYSVDNRIQVFIILGVGGSPDKPEEIYIIPLEKAKPKPYSNQIEQYKRYRDKGGFFYNAEKGTLE